MREHSSNTGAVVTLSRAALVIGLLLSVAVAALIGRHVHRVSTERAIVSFVKERGGWIFPDDPTWWPPRENIFAIGLDDTATTDEDLHVIARTPELVSLDLTNTKVSDEGIKTLADAVERMPANRHGKWLVTLGLGDTAVTDAGLTDMARLRFVESLDLSGTAVTGEGLATLSQLPQLRDLYLNRCQLGANDMLALKRCSQLRFLALGDRDIAEDEFQNIVDLRLEGIALGKTNITDEMVARLRDLERLQLFSTPITDGAVQALAGAPNLQVLDLSDTAISDASTQWLVQMPNLEYLHLEGTKFTDAGLLALAPAPDLGYVSLRRTSVTAGGAEAFKQLRIKLGKRPYITVHSGAVPGQEF
jgi:Leucine-rich repeat (LRR) protein